MKDSLQFQEKREPLTSAGIIALLLCFVFRIPLMNIIGAEGIAYFAPVNEILLLCIAFLNIGFAEALANMMKFRIKREQYRNAFRIYRIGYTITVVFACLAAFLILVFNNYISEVLLAQHLSKKALLVITPAIVLMAFTCLFRGYFQGMGSPYPSAHSMILEKVFSLTFGLLFAAFFMDYGVKAAAILRNDSFALSYGAMGAALGITISSVISFLHLFLIYLLYRGTNKRQIYRDNTRQIESPGFIYQSLLLTALPIGAYAVLYQVNNLIDQRLFYYYFDRLNIEETIEFNRAEIWGNYYGVFIVVIGILIVLISTIFIRASRLISSSWVREEYRTGREQLMQTITLMLVIAVPVASLVAVLAEPIVSLFKMANNEIAVRMFQSGSVMIVFCAFNLFWIDLFKQFKRTTQMLLLAGGGLVVHIVAIIVIMPMINKTEHLITGIIVTNIIGFGFSFFLGFFLISRLLKYQSEWVTKNLRTFVITLLCSAIVGLMSLFLSMGIINLVGPGLTILICLVISVIAYLVLMTLLRGLSLNELDKIPGGFILIRLGRFIRYF